MTKPQPMEILLALVNPVVGREDEFNEWYSGVHIPEILALPGFRSAQRYEVADDAAAAGGYRYATVYEIDNSALAARQQLFSGAVGTSDTVDTSQMVMAAFVPHGEPIER